MAARSNVTARRDFLRTLGLATGISMPEIAGSSKANASPSPAPTPSAGPTGTATPVPAPPADATPAPKEPAQTPAPEPQTQMAGAPPPVVPTAADRHLLSRFSYGVSQELVAEISARGASAWFEEQLDPASIPDDYADGLIKWYPQLELTPKQMYDEAETETGMQGYEQQDNFARWSLVRRIYSKRQLHESMVEFWSNMLHITAPLPKCFPWRVEYDKTLRANALGRFDELLVAAVLHPAMLCYLDAAKSTQKLLNENLGRELLELHTVGREAEFTEADVLDSARILTGWHVDQGATWEPSYVQLDHFIGPVKVLGFTAPNGVFDGREMSKDYIAYLARHPATATRIARRLAIRFVSDEPSDALVAHLAQVFTDSNTDIKTTLRALIAHPEFLASAGAKVRTPIEDACNTFRVLEVGMDKPTGVDGEAARAILSVAYSMGQKPFDWPRPDGFPDSDDSWSSASRALGSWRVHQNTTRGSYPRLGVTYHPESWWVPALPIRFDGFVNLLSQRLLAQDATPKMQRAAAKAVECLPDEYVLPNSTLLKFRVPDLLLSLLDTPQHMMR